MGLKELQKKIYQNKVNKGFNTTDIPKEFCLLYEKQIFYFWNYDRSIRFKCLY